MSDQTSRILNKIFEDEKLIKAHTPHFENFKKNIRRSEKSRQRNADEDKNSTIQQNDEITTSFSQQLRDAKTTMLRLQNLQRARFLKQQVQNIATKIQALRSDSIEFESSEMFNLKIVDAASTNVQSLTFENSSEIAADVLLSQISLSFKSKIIKFEKMRIYKD